MTPPQEVPSAFGEFLPVFITFFLLMTGSNSTAAIISEIGIPSPIPSPPNPPRTFELSSTSQVTALSSSVSPQRQLHSFSPTIPYHIGHFPEDRPPNGMQPVSLPITVTNALAPDSSRPALIDCSSSAEAEAGSIDMVQQCPFLPDVPDIQPIAVSDGGKFPQFSFKLPEPVACDQPPFQTMDLSLFGSGIFQENQESWLLPSAMCDRDSEYRFFIQSYDTLIQCRPIC
ncbi:hypothetical protein AN958_06326 [Leucoagaricus sp. SymC.cos]|nr:hypothetical protein AN958_06326 [Leucoagaricus sp. SymC.cos]